MSDYQPAIGQKQPPPFPPLGGQTYPQSPTVQSQPTIPQQRLQQPYPSYQPITSGTIQEPPGRLTIEKKSYHPLRAVGKLAFALFFLVAIISLVVTFGPNIVKPVSPLGNEENILLATTYKPVLWKDFGNVFEPQVTIPVQYPVEDYQKVDFLLDSGAVVSSLPREEAKKLGLSLAKLPRSTFSGFGGTLSFAYRGNIKMLLGKEAFSVPVVFTESAGTKPLLGRSGFFEQFSVYFNHRDKRIEIRK